MNTKQELQLILLDRIEQSHLEILRLEESKVELADMLRMDPAKGRILNSKISTEKCKKLKHYDQLELLMEYNSVVVDVDEFGTAVYLVLDDEYEIVEKFLFSVEVL